PPPPTSTLSLHDALPISRVELHAARTEHPFAVGDGDDGVFDGRCRFDLHLRLDTGGFGRDLRLAVEYVFQTQLVPALKFYRTPEDRKSTRLNSSHVSISY